MFVISGSATIRTLVQRPLAVGLQRRFELLERAVRAGHEHPRGLAEHRRSIRHVADDQRARADSRAPPIRTLRPIGARMIAPAPMPTSSAITIPCSEPVAARTAIVTFWPINTSRPIVTLLWTTVPNPLWMNLTSGLRRTPGASELRYIAELSFFTSRASRRSPLRRRKAESLHRRSGLIVRGSAAVWRH